LKGLRRPVNGTPLPITGKNGQPAGNDRFLSLPSLAFIQRPRTEHADYAKQTKKSEKLIPRPHTINIMQLTT
jgi:hypothetical protein